MSVALVTNYLPPYRLPLYSLLHERLGVEVFCFGGEAHYVPQALRDLDRQIATAPFPARRLARQRDARSLARSHEAVIASTAGRVALPAAFAGARRSDRPFVLWASLWRHPRTLAHMLSFPLLRRLYRESDAVLTYGTHVSAYVARVRGSEEGIFVAPQAVEPDVFGRTVGEDEKLAWRRQAGIEPDAPLALFAGRLVVDKGVEVLLSAWRDAGPVGAVLCLAGDGPLAQAARAVPGTHNAGRVDRAQLAVAYASADVVVVPSIPTRRFLEPWGLVCNEAMMQGTPVIATDAVGAAAGGLVKDRETGVVVPAGDPQALAAALSHLLGDAELRARLGARAREVVGAFAYERAADAFERALSHADYSRNR